MSIIPSPIPINDPGGALIGYDNLLTESTTALAEVALVPNTFERYSIPTGPLTVKFQMAALADVDYIAFAAHSLVGETLLISTATTVGGATTAVESITPLDDRAIMVTFDTRNIIEVIITATIVAIVELGVIYAGKLLRMPVAVYGGHVPMALAQQTEYQNVESESGQFLGRNVIRRGTAGNFSWQFLDPYWYRETFHPFVLSAVELPFFIAWRPDRFSNEVVFGFTENDIIPDNMSGGSGLMSVGLKMRAHSDI